MAPAAKKSKVTSDDPNEPFEVTNFREYIRIKSVQPDPDYEGCNQFLKRMADELELPYYIKEVVPKKPIFIMTWEGTKPELPSLLLNSHTDVVPVFPESWKHDPFAAVKEANGDIYGRGTQDMKSVTIQHIEAIRRLKQRGVRLNRTIHLSFVPDEEVGGFKGMAEFVKTEDFKKLNVGLALDEGMASPGDELPMYYGERNVYWIKFHCKGNPGHASQFIQGTAAAKVQYLINHLLAFREKEKKKLDADPTLHLGEVTTVNLTMMEGGVQMNVVPNQFTVGFDLRITPTTDLKAFEKMLEKMMEEAGGDIEMELLQKYSDQTLTSVAADDPWYKAFMKATEKNKLKVVPRIFPANTDSRYLRMVGIPAFGFSPMNNTPILLHDHNEFLNEKIFLRGIEVFEDIITEIASL